MAAIGAEPLVTPDLLMLECANVLARTVHRRRLATADARDGLRSTKAASGGLLPDVPFATQAQQRELELTASANDAICLAAALAENARLLTGGVRFAAAFEAACPSLARRL